jgi:hypothetical protein
MSRKGAQLESEQDRSVRRSSKAIFPLALVTMPAILFYLVTFRTALNIPFLDEYRCVLLFLNRWKLLHGFSTKLSFFLAWQLNEYKLFFLEGVVWLQYRLLGHVDFKILCLAGDLFILLLGILLWKMFLPSRKDLALRLAFFIPVSWLLFQLEYWEILNWASAELQHLSGIVFSLATLFFLLRTSRTAFGLAAACFILAFASSGSGLLLVPAGLAILVAGRRFAATAIWLCTSAGCMAAYFYHYNVRSSQVDPHRSIFAILLHINPVHMLGFAGCAAATPIASVTLGLLLWVFFGWMAWRGYMRRNPLISCCVLLLLITSIGVAGIRSEHPIEQFLTSRYTIYSVLLLIFAWFMIVEEFLQHGRRPDLNNNAYLASVTAAVLFSLFMDGVGLVHIRSHNQALIQGMQIFEHPSSPGSTAGLYGPYMIAPYETAQPPEFNVFARRTLIDSMQLGVYEPPQY